MSSAYDDTLATLNGALLVGCYLEALLQGVLFCQVDYYYHHYREDSIFFKFGVGGLVIVTSLKTCQSFAMLWIQFIQGFAEPAVALDNYFNNWALQNNPLMVAATGVYIRAYFCYRLYFISEKAWWAASIVAITELLSLSFIAVGTRLLVTEDNNQILLYYTLHFTFALIGDFLLSLLTALFLFLSKKRVLPQNQGFINALIQLTLETATPGAICSLVSLILSRFPNSGYKVIAAFNNIIPQLYAVTMMWTLNARHDIRALSMNSGQISSIRTSSNGSKAGAQTISRDNVEIELSQFNHVQVRKETVTRVEELDDVFPHHSALKYASTP